jgi:hypothetical protein
VGQVLQARDKHGHWYEGKVIKERGEGEAREVRVHFKGWSKGRDEWILVKSGYLRELGAPSQPRPLECGEAEAPEAEEEEEVVVEEEEEEEEVVDVAVEAELAVAVERRPTRAPSAQFDPSVGDELEARDRVGKWLLSKVINERGEGDAHEVRVHFKGWNKNHDEWIGIGIGRLREVGAQTPPRPVEQRELFGDRGYLAGDLADAAQVQVRCSLHPSTHSNPSPTPA